MTIKLFIGTSPNYEDREIEMVYEYSLRKNTKRELDITWMRLSDCRSSFWGGWNTENWFTPFSGFRWSIPEFCNFQGKAIYTDVDMINLNDIGELYSIDMQDKPIAARKGIRWNYEFCVMVIDCKRIKQHILNINKRKIDKDFHSAHKNYFNKSELVTEIAPTWNCLDGENFDISEIKQLHFTNMSTQPWKPKWFKGKQFEHPRQDLTNLFYDYKKEAEENGYTLRDTPTTKISYKIKL